MTGLYAHKLPPRDVEGEVQHIWFALQRLRWARPEDIKPMRKYLPELHELLDQAFGETQ